MLGLKAVAVSPRIEHHTLLRVVLREVGLQLVVETTLITIAPEDDTGVVDVALHHLLDNLRADDGLMRPMPTRHLALHVETQRVAGIQELGVGRVVRQAYGIHIHALD